MKRFLTLALIGACLISCRPLAIDISHASTDKGYLNSGLRDLGQLYYFDTQTGDLRELATLRLTEKVRGATFDRQVARDVRGIDIAGQLDAGTAVRVKANIQRNSFITLENAFDESYSNTFNDLSTEINRRVASGEDVGFTWFLDDAVQPGSTIRYLLVYSTIRADNATIGYDDTTAVGGGLTVPLRGAGDLDVTIRGLSEESFAGKSVPVLVEYHVVQAFQGDGFYKFRIDPKVSDETLNAILRGTFEPPEPEG